MQQFLPLADGARVALIAPSGPLENGDLDRAVANVRQLGWEPVVGTSVAERDGYLAGADALRLGDLNRALQDDSVRAVWCVRGGYGLMRLLDRVDYAALRGRPKAIIGYSDVTALHAAASRFAGVRTVHGPTARGRLTAFSERSLRAATSGGQPAGAAPDAVTLVPGRARGRLVGGNLSLLSALNGTPFQPHYAGAILVLEDVNEPAYRVERMLLQLRLAGHLPQCAGIAFGQFTNAPEDGSVGGTRPLADVLAEAARAAGVPAIAGIPLGHVADQWSLPLGAEAELDADSHHLTVMTR
jgi:muramoyltetrapeptide carboxypeptidase